MLHYLITPHVNRHRYSVQLVLPVPYDNLLKLELPTWTPGSYVLREYAGRLTNIRAYWEDNELPVRQVSKAQWVVDAAEAPVSATLRIEWEVFAYSVGIHDAYLDDDRGFINPSTLFLHPFNINEPAEVFFDAPGWNVQCALPLRANAWQARSLDELLDSPYTLTPKDGHGAHIWTVEACGVSHQIVITGANSLNRDRVSSDLRKIFETTIAFWDPDEKKPPFERYLLQMHLGVGLYGGLEHAAGTMLLEDPKVLPAEGETKPPKDYIEFLTLAAHEYFHAWLVKRLKPSCFLPYDLSKEVYSHDLWIFEGFTSLYESIIPLRAGLIDEATYWDQFGRRFNNALGREGFDQMTLAESSFNAWIKLYRQTKDSPYSQTSYYAKGALAAFLISDTLEQRSNGEWSLEHVLQSWFRGVRSKITENNWSGLPDGGFAELVFELTGISIADVIEHWVSKPNVDRSEWIAAFSTALEHRGKKLTLDANQNQAYALSGLKLRHSGADHELDYVPSASPAFEAGLFAGDVPIALDGMRITFERFDRMVEACAGRIVEIVFFRGDRLIVRQLDLASPRSNAFLMLLPQRVIDLS